MTWQVGQAVVKRACADDCPCDGREIPPGTAGMITEIRHRDHFIPDEPYLCVDWQRPLGKRRTWWVYEHALEPQLVVPDMFYLDL